MSEEALKAGEGDPSPGEEAIQAAPAVEITLPEDAKPASNMIPEESFLKRVGKLKNKVVEEREGRTAAESRIDTLEEENKYLRERLVGGSAQRPGQPQGRPGQPGNPLPPPPREEDFDSHEAYQQAYQQWDNARIMMISNAQTARILQQREQSKQSTQKEEALNDRLRKHHERASSSPYPDYEQKEDAAIAVLGPNVSKQLMAYAEQSDKILYILGSDPELAQHYRRMMEQNSIDGLIKLGHLAATTRIDVRQSDAPEPDGQISGQPAESSQSYQKRIDQMRKEGRPTNEVIALKREARAAGATVY